MPAWASAAQARDDLRRFLSDGPQDKPVKQKQVVGLIDGVNKRFVAWDDRLIAGTLVVYVNSTALPASEVTLDDTVLGEFTLQNAPAAQSTLRAQYFFQFFLDAELDEALQMAAGEIVESDDITLISPGLKQAALNFGGYFGFMKQAARWIHRASSKFVLEEEPVEGEVESRAKHFQDLAKFYLSTGRTLRDDYYKRHGRREAPSFAVYKPVIRQIAPRR